MQCNLFEDALNIILVYIVNIYNLQIIFFVCQVSIYWNILVVPIYFVRDIVLVEISVFQLIPCYDITISYIYTWTANILEAKFVFGRIGLE